MVWWIPEELGRREPGSIHIDPITPDPVYLISTHLTLSTRRTTRNTVNSPTFGSRCALIAGGTPAIPVKSDEAN